MKEIFEQIENELVYAKIKHPKHTLTLVDARNEAIRKLGKHNYYSCSFCGVGYISCPDEQMQICTSFATIVILMRSINDMYKKDENLFNERNKHLIQLISKEMEKKS